MEFLYEKKLQSLLVEGGSMLLQSFIDSDLWDEAYIEQSPIFLKEGVAAPTIQKNILKRAKDTLEEIFFMPATHRLIDKIRLISR